MGVVAQLDNDFVRALRAIKALCFLVLLAVTEIADTVENPLALSEAFLVALVVDEDDAWVELHRVADFRIRGPSRTNIGLVFIEQLGQHSVVEVLRRRDVQLDVEVGLADGAIRHVVVVRLDRQAVFIGIDELALAVNIHVSAGFSVGVGACALSAMDHALILPAVLRASAVQEVLNAGTGDFIVLVGRETWDLQLDNAEARILFR